MRLYFAGQQLVRRDDAHAARAGRDEHEFRQAADDADLYGFLPQAGRRGRSGVARYGNSIAKSPDSCVICA
jgi:hypothetical protein